PRGRTIGRPLKLVQQIHVPGCSVTLKFKRGAAESRVRRSTQNVIRRARAVKVSFGVQGHIVGLIAIFDLLEGVKRGFGPCTALHGWRREFEDRAGSLLQTELAPVICSAIQVSSPVPCQSIGRHASIVAVCEAVKQALGPGTTGPRRKSKDCAIAPRATILDGAVQVAVVVDYHFSSRGPIAVGPIEIVKDALSPWIARFGRWLQLEDSTAAERIAGGSRAAVSRC